MARIARRGLRIRGLPLFSLGEPWQSVANTEGKLGLRLFEPRYVEMARRVLPPAGQGKFGYAESYPPRAGASGILAEIEDFRWVSEASGEPLPEATAGHGPESQQVLLMARGSRRFRILSTRTEGMSEGQAPLYLAHVQLLEDRDVVRGPGVEAISYWLQDDTKGREDESAARASGVKAGSHLVAHMGAPVFESPESWRVIGQVPAGVRVIAGGPPTMVEGYLMVPIVPSGAVELALFRCLAAPGDASTQDDEVALPAEAALKATLLNLGQEPSASVPPKSQCGRKHSRGLGGKFRGRQGR